MGADGMNNFNYTWDWSFGSAGATYHRGDGTTVLEDEAWVDNEGNPMRDNLGNKIIFTGED